MSEQNRTAPRWQDVPEAHRTRFAEWMSEERRYIAKRLASRDDEVRDNAAASIAIIDAALARLAEPAQPTAAERWRAVPADVRRIVLRWVERGQAQAHRDNVDAYHALLALAREAEGGGV